MAADTLASLPDEAAIRNILRQVIDPEAGIDIVELGLIYRIEVTAAAVRIEMTMTSPACPLGDMIMDDVKARLSPALPPGCAADIVLVWEPPWEPSMMSESGKQHFGW